MCGIAGIVGLTERHESERRLDSMLSGLEHRGPDAVGSFVSDGIALGQRRLSIIDLSAAANQPMYDAGGRYAVIQNGEIYNYREVKKELCDYPFRTESDTEVIIAAYERYGPRCVEQLNGMFAIAVWDREKQELFVARDRMGVKPLYYSVLPGGVFVFASEIRAILESGLVDRGLDQSSISEYLLYQSVYSPNTIVRGIKQLPAGSVGVFSNGNLSIEHYWRLDDARNEGDYSSLASVQKGVRRLLSESIERRMISDVRLGAFLSGGIDSSIVVGLMSEVSGRPVNTFSVQFDEENYDESQYSDLIAKRFKTDHTAVKLRASDFLDALPSALAAVDSPTGDGFNTYVVSKATRKAGIKVALSGLGGDELFAGYDYFQKWSSIKRSPLFKLPAMLRRQPARLLAGTANSKFHRMGEILGTERQTISTVYPLFRQVMSRRLAHKYFEYSNGGPTINKILTERAETINKFPTLSQVTIAELLGYTQSVLLKDTDQFSMASALEIREPFFDYKLVEYVLSIPDKWKEPLYPKKLLVEAVSPLLPDEVVHRRKMGFVLPWEDWMRGELRGFCENKLAILTDLDLLNSAHLNSRWQSFQGRRNGVLWSEFWHLIVLADWIERNGFANNPQSQIS